MAKEDPITQALGITDHSLREFFPTDFFRRCWYAAFGLSALLEDAGVAAQVVGGDFLFAVVSSDRTQLSLQGFGRQGSAEPSHFWVHAKEHLLDLGPMYLPNESSFPASALPVLRWPLSTSLPAFAIYRERARYAREVVITDPAIR